METSIDRMPIPSMAEILGHLAPGGALLGSIFLFEIWIVHAVPELRRTFHVPLVTLLGFAKTELGGENWLLPVLLGLGLLLMIYVAGHVVESVSSLLIDRTFIYRAYGYPYEHLFGYAPREPVPPVVPQPPSEAAENPDDSGLEAEGADVSDPKPAAEPTFFFPKAVSEPAPENETRAVDPYWLRFSRSYYRVVFLWINVYLFLRWLGFAERIWGYSWWARAVTVGADLVMVFVGALIIGMVMLNTRVRPRVERVAAVGGAHGFNKVVWLLLRKPYDLAVKPFSTSLNTRRSFDRSFVAKYERSFRRIFRMDPVTAESNNYWLSLIYVRTRSKTLAHDLLHWQTMYEFSRNLSTAFYLGGIYCLTSIGLHARYIPNWRGNGIHVLVWLPFILLTLACAMLVHFYYYYVCYYSKFLYRAFVFQAEFDGPARRVRHADVRPADTAAAS